MEVGELAGVFTDALTPEMVAYLDHLLLRKRAKTARTVGQNLVQFAQWCRREGVEPLMALRSQLDDYLVWLSTTYRTPAGKPLARTTLSTRIYNLKAWYAWLEARGSVVINPAQHLHVRVPKSRVVVREHLTQQEATALVQTQAAMAEAATPGTYTWRIQRRNLALICLALASGRRIGGLIGMHAAHVDCDRCEVRVEREKGRMGRVLPIADWAAVPLREYLDRVRPALIAHRDVPWLFVDREGDGPITRDSLKWVLAELLKKTIAANPDLEGLPGKTITWHSLRVTFATLLFANGCPIRSVNELMLHESLSTTARYTPIPIEDMQAIWRTAHPRP